MMIMNLLLNCWYICFSYDVATSKQIEVVIPYNSIVFLCFCFFCFLRNSEMTCLSVEIDTYCYSVHYFIVIVIVIVVIVVGLCHYLFCETLMGLGARAPEAFREDCARIWGNLYDYSMTKYQENRMGIPWIS